MKTNSHNISTPQMFRWLPLPAFMLTPPFSQPPHLEGATRILRPPANAKTTIATLPEFPSSPLALQMRIPPESRLFHRHRLFCYSPPFSSPTRPPPPLLPPFQAQVNPWRPLLIGLILCHTLGPIASSPNPKHTFLFRLQ